MLMTSANKWLITAWEKGYRVSPDGIITNPTGKRLNGYWHKGYQRIKIGPSIGGVGVLAHRLQAYQKFGNAIFEDGIQVRHLDGDSSNNTWCNIAIGTASQNSMDRPRDMRRKLAYNASSKRKSSIPKEKLESIHRDRDLGMTYNQLKDKYGLSKSTLSYHLSKTAKRQAWIQCCEKKI